MTKKQRYRPAYVAEHIKIPLFYGNDNPSLKQEFLAQISQSPWIF